MQCVWLRCFLKLEMFPDFRSRNKVPEDQKTSQYFSMQTLSHSVHFIVSPFSFGDFDLLNHHVSVFSAQGERLVVED